MQSFRWGGLSYRGPRDAEYLPAFYTDDWPVATQRVRPVECLRAREESTFLSPALWPPTGPPLVLTHTQRVQEPWVPEVGHFQIVHSKLGLRVIEPSWGKGWWGVKHQ